MNDSLLEPHKQSVEVTDEELGLLSFQRWARKIPREEYRREFKILRRRVLIHWRSRKNLWGRFGGGWNWKFGFQAGDNTVILSLLVFDITIRK